MNIFCCQCFAMHIATKANGFFFQQRCVWWRVYLYLQNRSIAYYRETHLYASQILAIAIANGKLNFPSSVIWFFLWCIQSILPWIQPTKQIWWELNSIAFDSKDFFLKKGFRAKEMIFFKYSKKFNNFKKILKMIFAIKYWNSVKTFAFNIGHIGDTCT